MKKPIIYGAFLATLFSLGTPSYALAGSKLIDKQQAIEAALSELGIEVLGARFDKPDKQWDVFVKSGNQAYEIEIDAVSGKVIEKAKESLEEIQAELSGDLSHEGVSGDVD